MNHKLNNTVVLSLNPEHGAEIIKAWKELGIDTGDMEGTRMGFYYGVIDNDFVVEDKKDLPSYIKIITLPELQAMAEPQQTERTFPREMIVADRQEDLLKFAVPCVVLGMFEGRYIVGDSDEWFVFKYAREIE